MTSQVPTFPTTEQIDSDSTIASLSSMFEGYVKAVRLRPNQRAAVKKMEDELYSRQGMSLTFGHEKGQFVSATA